MARPELGTKRQCGECGAKFYDLAKSPIVCPKCNTVFEVVGTAPRREAPRAAAPAPEAAEEAVEVAAAEDVEVVSLAEVEADEAVDVEVEDDDIAVVGDDDADIEEEDDTFLAEDEDDDDDVSGLIGGGIAGEDEEV